MDVILAWLVCVSLICRHMASIITGSQLYFLQERYMWKYFKSDRSLFFKCTLRFVSNLNIVRSGGCRHLWACLSPYVRTLWRPTMNATFLLQGLTKEDQEVSIVRYSPFRAHIRNGECSNGCPANCRTTEWQNNIMSDLDPFCS